MPAIPKSSMPTRAQERARERRQAAKARKACVDAVWKRAGSGDYGRCEGCGRLVARTSAYAHMLGHVHEVIFRSRGGNPHDPDGCKLYCYFCHGHAHGLRFGSEASA